MMSLLRVTIQEKDISLGKLTLWEGHFRAELLWLS